MEGERRGERPKRITRRELLGLERLGEWFKTKNQHSSVNVGVGSKTTPEREAASEVGRSLFDFLHNLYLPRRSFLKISGSVIATFLLAACGGKNRTGGGSGTEDQTKEVSVTPSATLEPATPTEEPAAPKEQPTATPTLEHYQLLFEELRSSIVQIEDKYPDAGFFIRSGVGEQSEIDQKLCGNFFSEETQFTSQDTNHFDGYSPEEKQLLVQISQQYEQLETEHGYYTGVNIPQGTDFQVQVSNPTDPQTYINFSQDYNLDKELSLQFSAIRFYKEDGRLKVAFRVENAMVGTAKDDISGSVWVSVDARVALDSLQKGGRMTSVALARTGGANQLRNVQVGMNKGAEFLNGYTGSNEISMLDAVGLLGNPDNDLTSQGHYVNAGAIIEGEVRPAVAGGICNTSTALTRVTDLAATMRTGQSPTKDNQPHGDITSMPNYDTNYRIGAVDMGSHNYMEWDATVATDRDGNALVDSGITPASEINDPLKVSNYELMTYSGSRLIGPSANVNGQTIAESIMEGPYLIQIVTVK
jgi:hypothetical protein